MAVTSNDAMASAGITRLGLDMTFMRGGQVEQYVEEEQVEDLERIKSLISFAALKSAGTSSLLVVRDVELSEFPHNLVLDGEGEFLSRRRPVSCLPSAEWLIEDQRRSGDAVLGSRTSIWVPTAAGDFALNLLWSQLSTALTHEPDLEVSNSAVPEKPLTADINILIAHGNPDIPVFHDLHLSGDATLLGVRSIVGPGTIAVLLSATLAK